MEDCYDIKLTKVDGDPVNLFGVFDGTISPLHSFSMILCASCLVDALVN